jgi:HPt (histidine-containing phosphotransfer) domain-containing protein
MNNAGQLKVCNLDYLHDISKGDDAFIEEMITIFLSENPSEIQKLENGITEKNFDTIKHAAHKLRSTLPFVGLDRLIEKESIEIEELAGKHSNPERIKELFAKVKDICQKAFLELQGRPK